MANNGTGAGTLILGSLNDGGTACTITKADNGLLVLSASATSLVQGTKVNISGGTLAVAAIGTRAVSARSPSAPAQTSASASTSKSVR